MIRSLNKSMIRCMMANLALLGTLQLPPCVGSLPTRRRFPRSTADITESILHQAWRARTEHRGITSIMYPNYILPGRTTVCPIGTPQSLQPRNADRSPPTTTTAVRQVKHPTPTMHLSPIVAEMTKESKERGAGLKSNLKPAGVREAKLPRCMCDVKQAKLAGKPKGVSI